MPKRVGVGQASGDHRGRVNGGPAGIRNNTLIAQQHTGEMLNLSSSPLHQIRTGHQHEDCWGAKPHHAAWHTRNRRRGNRVSVRSFVAAQLDNHRKDRFGSFSSDRPAPDALGMSASLRSRPNLRTAANRRGVPLGDITQCSKAFPLLDHFVGELLKAERDIEAERLGSL
jgi:hypothetical protein